MAVVETRNLTKVFKQGELGAVNDVSLATEEGEFLVFLGPSGSGKTTLLRMIAGLETPTSGEILIGGQVVNHLSPRERRIAMVFQSYALYPHLTVYKNIAFPLKAQKVPKDQHDAKVQWAAGLLGIGRLLHRKPRELSGGERQRVALARAIVREPAVFLLDEPLSNLDAKLRASAREELEQFQTRVGTTTIYVTHDQVEAMAMGDRVVVMDKGRVRQIGTPAEVYDEPADTFVATFLGSPPMNLVSRRRHRSRASGPSISFPLAPSPSRSRSRCASRSATRSISAPSASSTGRSRTGPVRGAKVVSRIASTHAGVFAKDTDVRLRRREAPPEALRPTATGIRKR